MTSALLEHIVYGVFITALVHLAIILQLCWEYPSSISSIFGSSAFRCTGFLLLVNLYSLLGFFFKKIFGV